MTRTAHRAGSEGGQPRPQRHVNGATPNPPRTASTPAPAAPPQGAARCSMKLTIRVESAEATEALWGGRSGLAAAPATRAHGRVRARPRSARRAIRPTPTTASHGGAGHGGRHSGAWAAAGCGVPARPCGVARAGWPPRGRGASRQGRASRSREWAAAGRHGDARDRITLAPAARGAAGHGVARPGRRRRRLDGAGPGRGGRRRGEEGRRASRAALNHPSHPCLCRPPPPWPGRRYPSGASWWPRRPGACSRRAPTARTRRAT